MKLIKISFYALAMFLAAKGISQVPVKSDTKDNNSSVTECKASEERHWVSLQPEIENLKQDLVKLDLNKAHFENIAKYHLKKSRWEEYLIVEDYIFLSRNDERKNKGDFFIYNN